MLNDKIEELSCSISCWQSGSCWCRWSRSAGCWGDPQVTSCHGEPEYRAGDLQATSCHRGTIWLWTQSPSPTQQKCQVTFAEGRAPMLGKKSLEREAGVDKAYQMLQPTWGTNGMMHNDSNWLRLEGGEEELECLLPLDPTTRSSWVGRRHFWLVQQLGMATHKLQCPTTPNLPPCKMKNGYGGTLNR